jgi:hypothetical protein
MMATNGNWSRWFTAVVVVVAAVLLVAPVKAKYIARVGSDFIEYRTATCGAPVLSLLGNNPGLGGGSPHPIGAVNASQACKGTAGTRTTLGASLLLLGALVLWLMTRRSKVGIALDDVRAEANAQP